MKPAVISDQGLCEDLLRRASYIIQFKKKEQCNAEYKLYHKNVDKGEEVQWQGESMDLWFELSFKNMLQEMKC